ASWLRAASGSPSALRLGLGLKHHGRVVPPLADALVLCRLPGGVVHRPAAPAKFELKAAGGLSVEREHAIVGVTTQRLHDGHTGIQAPIETQADLVHVPRLQHEVVDALSLGPAEGQRVVPGVGVEERQIDGVAMERTADMIAEAKAQQLAVEVGSLGLVSGADHAVT